MGPMAAAEAFLVLLAERVATDPPPDSWLRIHVSLHGSLAFTGRGHATDRAIVFGLLGHRAGDIDIDKAEGDVAVLRQSRHLPPLGGITLAFDPHHHIFFDYGPPLPGHPNGMEFHAIDAEGVGYLSQIYYSIGGGFIVNGRGARRRPGGAAAAMRARRSRSRSRTPPPCCEWQMRAATPIAQMMLANERALRSDAEVDAGLAALWAAMDACIDRGLARQGELPGGLRVKRRASALFEQLCDEQGSNSAQPHVYADWLTVYAMAVQ